MFKLYVSFLSDAGLIGKTTIAIDGSKFRAVNSKKNNYNQNKIDKYQKFIEDKTNRYLQELDELDKQEGKSADELIIKKEKIAAGLEKLKERTIKYDLLQQLTFFLNSVLLVFATFVCDKILYPTSPTIFSLSHLALP